MSDYTSVVDETTTEDGTPFRVVIVQDSESSDLDPRRNDVPAGVIVALDTRDGRKWRPREDADDRANADTIVDAIQDHAFQTVARWLRVFHGASVVLPLYESTDGLTTGEPDDTAGPDEYRGVTFDTPATRQATGYPDFAPTVGTATWKFIQDALEADVAEWADWARGDVFGYIVQRGDVTTDGDVEWCDDPCPTCDMDSCWGLIGDDWARDAARRALEDFVSRYDTDHPAEAAV